MTLDPVTLLVMTIALAAAAAFYLAIEWLTVRDRSLVLWSSAFALVSVGSTLSLLRMSGMTLVGVWGANGMLIVVHWLFLLGVARFTETRVPKRWYLVFAVWLGMLALPSDPSWSKTMLVVQSVIIAAISIKASVLLRPWGRSMTTGAAQLRYVLMAHGIFYLTKTIPGIVPGTLIDLTAFRGEIIQISLVEGVMALMLIALSMTGTVRYRREQRIEQLAARDPLTSLFNRRALEAFAPRLVDTVTESRPGGLLLIDVDNFKQVNDLHGHGAGDELLQLLGELIRSTVPSDAFAARLGGDEFIVLWQNASATQVVEIGNRLRERFQERAVHFITPNPVTLSIGASLFDQPPADLTALIRQGDIGLYASKRGGRNSVRLADSVSPKEIGGATPPERRARRPSC